MEQSTEHNAQTDAAQAVEDRRPGSLGDLHDLLDEKMPHIRTRLGFFSVEKLASKLAVSPQAIYNWFSREKVPANRVEDLIKISRDKLTYDDIRPFVFK